MPRTITTGEHAFAAIEQLQRRVRGVHRLAQLKGDDYHAEMDAIASRLGELKLELREWAPPSTTTWRPPRSVR